MSEERFSKIEKGLESHARILAELEKGLAILVSQTENHFADSIKNDERIKAIDENVDSILLTLAKLPSDLASDHRRSLDGIWLHIRKNEQEFHECKETMPAKILKDGKSYLHSHVIALWAVFLIIFGLSAFIVVDTRNDTNTNRINIEKNLTKINSNNVHINSHHKIHGGNSIDKGD